MRFFKNCGRNIFLARVTGQHNYAGYSLADPGGRRGARPPNRINFFRFRIRFRRKVYVWEVGAAPNGKSWIRHWYCGVGSDISDYIFCVLTGCCISFDTHAHFYDILIYGKRQVVVKAERFSAIIFTNY